MGNPPYVRQELLSPIKPYLQERYQTYHGMADLYVYSTRGESRSSNWVADWHSWSRTSG